MFKPELEILPEPQKHLWNELIDVPECFTLYDGTAIALYFKHRQSVDFDFFGTQHFDPDDLVKAMPFLTDAEMMQHSPDTLTARVDRGGPVLVSFFGLPEIGRINTPNVAEDNGLKVAALIDLAGIKAIVVQKHANAKDYIDMAALIEHGIDLSHALAASQAIYGKRFNPQITLKALSYFDDGDLKTLLPQTKRLLQEAVRAVNPAALPVIEADKKLSPPEFTP